MGLAEGGPAGTSAGVFESYPKKISASKIRQKGAVESLATILPGRSCSGAALSRSEKENTSSPPYSFELGKVERGCLS